MNSKISETLLLVGPLPPPETGQSVSFEMLCRELKKADISINIVNLSRSPNYIKSGFSIRRSIEMAKVLSSFFRSLTRSPQCIYLTIAQSKSGFYRDAIMIGLAWLFKIRIIVHLKGGNYDGFYNSQGILLQCAIRSVLLKVDRILVLGESLIGMYDFEPKLKNKIRVVPNGLPVRLQSMTKSLPNITKNEPIELLFLSNLIQTKGYLHILVALKELIHSRKVCIRCTFAGRFLSSSDDELVLSAEEAQKHFIRSVKEYNLEQHVVYAGPVSGHDKWSLLQKAHIFLLPTKYINEGQPVSIIEAMAHGCVTITTNFRAISDLVIDGETGIIVEYNAPFQIANAIHHLASNHSRFAAMSIAAKDRFERLFTMKSHINRILPFLTAEDQ